MMSKLVTALGVVYVLFGLWIAVFPDQLVSMADWESRGGLNLAASMRVITGLFLMAVAPVTTTVSTPQALR